MIIKTQRDGFLHGVPSEITPAGVYQQRRTLMKHLATGVAGAALASWAARQAMAQGAPRPGKLAALPGGRSAVAGASTTRRSHTGVPPCTAVARSQIFPSVTSSESPGAAWVT